MNDKSPAVPVISLPRVMPRSYVYEVTSRCNLSCSFCYNVWKIPDQQQHDELTTAGSIAMLDKLLQDTGADHITITGGEPLLREDLPEIISFLKHRGCGINLISNGTLLDGKLMNLLSESISVFQIPLLSSERSIHEELSSFAGAFEAVTRAIADLKSKNATVIAVFVATRMNLPTWRETFELAALLGVDGIMFNRFNPGGAGIKNFAALQADVAEIQSALDCAEELSGRYNIPVSCSIAMPPCLFKLEDYRHIQFGYCAAGTARAYYTIDAVGNVRPCNHSPTVLGNLHEISMGEILNSPVLADFVRARPSFCNSCSLENICLGGCKAAAEACHKTPWALDPFIEKFKHLARRV